MQLKRFTNEEIGDSYNTCGIDFDGTLTQGGYPNIGEPIAHAQVLIDRLKKLGYKLIIYTCRTSPYLLSIRKITLDKAIEEIEEWLEKHGITGIDGIIPIDKPLFDRYIGDEAWNDRSTCKLLGIEVECGEGGSSSTAEEADCEDA